MFMENQVRIKVLQQLGQKPNPYQYNIDKTMGIKGLMTFCRENITECSEKVDLIKVAKQRKGIIILVDFYAFEYMMMGHFWTSITRVSANDYLPFDGGEYASLDAYLSKFITDLKDVGIEFEFFVDGAPIPETAKLKFNNWQKRHAYKVKRLQQVVEMTKGNRTARSITCDARLTPVLLEVQILATLKAYGCRIHQIPCGEADHVLAKELNSNDKAFAVLSDDSDFLAFPGSKLIYKDYFDVERDLKLGQARALPAKPSKLMCNILGTEEVSACLQLTDPRQMTELSILAGNDFTSPYLNGGLLAALRLPKKDKIPALARWISEHEVVENNPTFKRKMESKKGLKEAVHHSRRFYNLTLEPDLSAEDDCPENVLINLLRDGIEEGEFPPDDVMEMHRGIFWRKLMHEDTQSDHPCSEEAMVDLRSFIYRLLLPEGKDIVIEHGRCKDAPYGAVEIRASKENLKSLTLHMPEDMEDNLLEFDRIMSHLEPGAFQTTWFGRYGRKDGFICYILRYFLVLNWNCNLHVSKSEFLALVSMVFCPSDEKRYQKLVIRPSIRCVTIGNWFQNIYRHAYLFLGKLLHLTHEFPLPKEIFSGSVWTTFYTCSSEEARQARGRQVDRGTLRGCQRDMEAVIQEKRNMIRYLTEHFFAMDD